MFKTFKNLNLYGQTGCNVLRRSEYWWIVVDRGEAMLMMCGTKMDLGEPKYYIFVVHIKINVLTF